MKAAASGSGEAKGDEYSRLIFRGQGHQPNIWSFLGEIRDVLYTSVHRSFPHVEEIRWFESEKEHTVYNCLSVFSISSIIRKNNRLRIIDYDKYKVPKDIGREIKTCLELLASDMIQTPSIQDFGIVAFSLSRQWLAKSIHKMLKDGIDTWTPPLPLGRVVIRFPSLDDERLMGSFQQHVIADTLRNMLMHSNVSVCMPIPHKNRGVTFQAYTGQTSWEGSQISIKQQDGDPSWEGSQISIKQQDGDPSWEGSQISIKQQDGDLVISVEEKPPFILAEGDFHKFYIDLESLWWGIDVEHADWIVYVTPARQQEYIDMCFAAAKLKGWIKTDMKEKWNPSFANEYPVLTYAGYRTYSTNKKELANLLDQLKACCDEVARGADAQLFGYTAEEVLNCVLMYTCLKNHRLTDCTFNFDEMVKEERRAEVHRITYNFYSDIYKLRKTSDLVLEEYEGRQEREERMLEFHLLEFSDVLEESILFISPHVMCNYLYGLSKKFKCYIDSVPMTGSVAETSILLLCEATAVVMDRCFALLGFTSVSSSTYSLPFTPLGELLQRLQSSANLPMDVYASMDVEVGVEPAINKQRKMAEREQMDETDGSVSVDRSLLTGLRIESPPGGLRRGSEFVDYFITPCFVSDARDPCRKSRFEVFAIRPLITESTFKKGYLFGLISVSDKYGLQSDGGYPLFEPDFPYVRVFDHEWYDPVNMSYPKLVYLDSYHSVPFSSSVNIRMELDASNEKKDACFQLCDNVIEIDLKDIWAERLNAKCGCIDVKGEDGSVMLYYIPIKDAVDTALEISFKGEETYCDREVYGRIYANYGNEFPYDCSALEQASYKALLFSSYPAFRMPRGLLPLKRSALAVPRNGSLLIQVSFVDAETHDVILCDLQEFIPPTEENSEHIHIGDVKGTDCSLELKVVWK